MKTTELAIASDHAGYALKEALKKHLDQQGIYAEDFGTNSEASCDYPDYAHPLAAAVDNGRFPIGIVICGSGNGVCMTVNKHQGIRGALVWTEELASLARKHNDANVLCIPARFISEELAFKITDLFLSTDFEGGRHATRVDKI